MSTSLERELRDYKELSALLTERLDRLQRANENAYIEAFEAHGGPHLCPGLPFGHQPEQVTS
ncbi:hypothetical protein AB0471_25735 [Streptomyces sp. NPDC052002]|uniref:hypothetical protein n=1 Tax=Streptomyces sp. NPDC052002 TaxID=3155754 RepID=UPI00344BDB84